MQKLPIQGSQPGVQYNFDSWLIIPILLIMLKSPLKPRSTYPRIFWSRYPAIGIQHELPRRTPASWQSQAVKWICLAADINQNLSKIALYIYIHIIFHYLKNIQTEVKLIIDQYWSISESYTQIRLYKLLYIKMKLLQFEAFQDLQSTNYMPVLQASLLFESAVSRSFVNHWVHPCINTWTQSLTQYHWGKSPPNS